MKYISLAMIPCCVLMLGGCSHQERPHGLTSIQEQQVQNGSYLTVNSAEAAIKYNPNNALAHENLAQDLMGRDYPRAESELRICLRLQPGNRKADFLLAHALMKTNQRNEAKEIWLQLASGNDIWAKAASKNLRLEGWARGT